MLKECVEDDFYELRMVAVDRLSPDGISVFFWGAFAISAVVTSVLDLGIFGSSHHVTSIFWVIIANVSIVLLITQLLFTFLYSKEKYAYRFQRLQSILLSIISLKTSTEFYLALLIFCMGKNVPNNIRTTAIILCIGGLIYLIVSTIRGIQRVRKGEFRKGGKGLYNFAQSKAQISFPIVFGVTMLGGSIFKVLSDSSVSFGPLLQLYFFLLLCVVFQYAVAFAWPEFFLLTYCKFRFDSFIIPMPKRPIKENKTTKRTKTRKNQTYLVTHHNKQKKKSTEKKVGGGKK
ncbi:hypothetical protein B5V88_07525 [Heyndrickxia sporothermodurans]|uniref:Uncharacterized protein n=1 Tax=Heyndrickxia sporothermodurans TaxID=46224 RepID=A0AB37HF42_9BACI|nr:hypothetical protein [Heyndrickxia sporothermodurans]MBL5766993.1 hypothetical protein [Heyndrickxia sporothermodurans]MBL5770461.1 hypothetical protein [Heyndrickxia sporothermodurans]MBL5774150.1 hypothetical protein [Heyndrickxia sporothermodurans]MBL5778306.1 hypothetical protein [Heyndrickxia sporothermodurans]MBL5780687.1 hypothetical protein [Heyndrickxia sporothermodurans]